MPDYYEMNLRALNESHPNIAYAIADTPPSSCIHIDTSETGLPVLRITDPELQDIFVYDRTDPLERVEAELGGLAFRAEDATLLMGFGLGYHAEAISRRMEIDHQLFVVEPCPAVLRTALSQRDLRHILQNDRVHLFTGPGLTGLYDVMEYHLLRIVAGNLNELTLTHLESAFPGPYAEAEDRARKIRFHLELSFRFNIDNDHLLRNVLENAGSLKECSDMGSLEGLLDGMPAIVVAGGPSLSKNIHQLAEASGKAAILCVDTALKPLLACGIQPDMVVSADPFPQNARKIEGLFNGDRIPLLFDIGAHHAIPGFFNGPKFVASSQNALAKWLIGLIGFHNSPGRTTSAAHLAFNAARLMKADPIVFVGLDLAFPGGAHHVEGSAFTWAPSDNSTFVQVPDVFGGTVKTIPGFQAMIGLFEREIAETRARCIDATEGGARIAGTEICPLSEVNRRLAQPGTPLPRTRIEKAYRSPSDEKLAALRNGVDHLKRQAHIAGETSKEALPQFVKAKGLLSKGKITSPKFIKAASRILKLDETLGEQKLFDKVLIDFRAELLAFQFLQSYKIQRETGKLQNLALTFESIENSFRDAGRISEKVLPFLRNFSTRGPENPGHQHESQPSGLKA